MAIRLYMDHHVPRAITIGLKLRGIDVLTAYEDKSDRLNDSDLLDRARSLNRVLFTQDDDLLTEATLRQRQGIPFDGIIYAHQRNITIGTCIDDLELIAHVAELKDFINWVQFLPL